MVKKNKIKYSIGEKIMKRREEANEVKKQYQVYDPEDKPTNPYTCSQQG